MAESPTPYDTLAYPSAVFRQAQPDRLALVARLHALSPAPVETARMLDIGGGDGLNAIALGVAYPHATFVNFDLAPSVIARGRRWAEQAGAGNVRLEVLDIMDAAERLEGTFDYITAHGVYAWVPGDVRAAIFPLIARLLAPGGVAMVSFNALPGGYSRLALRGLLNAHLDPALSPHARLSRARAILAEFAIPQENDQPIIASMRREAENMLKRPEEVLYHDELGSFYAPQALADVAAAAAASGLAYLNEAGMDMLDHGFVRDTAAAEPDTATLVSHLHALDFVQGRYFRNAVFVRAEAAPSRRFDIARIAQMWVSSFAEEDAADNAVFRVDGAEVAVTDARMADALRRLAQCWPERIQVCDLFDDTERLRALYYLVQERLVDLYTVPAPFTARPGAYPEASRLVRALIADGQTTVATLDHRALHLGDPRAIALLELLDGTRDRAALERDWLARGNPAEITLEAALKLVARGAMLVR